MRILIVTAFSSGICGVWTRTFEEAKLLKEKGHEVYIFSSNIHRGGGERQRAKKYEELKGVKIYRFPTFLNFGKNTYFWNFKKKAINLKPDIIVTHVYRHYHSTKALEIAKKLKIPCFLVTHAPFLEKKLRSWKLNLAVNLYDKLVGKRILNHYKKIIAITPTEIKHLVKLGAKKEKIAIIPNGIPEEFFKIKNNKSKEKKLLFLGRVSPIKDLETLIKALKIVKANEKNIVLEIIGPSKKEYYKKISKLIKDYDLKDSIKFLGKITDIKQKIKEIDNSTIFILPSKREGMPQSLIEAMARKKIVITSKIEGTSWIIKEGETGFLFQVGNEKELADKILYCLKNKNKLKIVEENAKKFVEKFNWHNLIKKVEITYTNK